MFFFYLTGKMTLNFLFSALASGVFLGGKNILQCTQSHLEDGMFNHSHNNSGTAGFQKSSSSLMQTWLLFLSAVVYFQRRRKRVLLFIISCVNLSVLLS